ncbi:hypothetical protein HDK77DRAFT_447666 [Phyllosticta capitalensis]
MRCTSTTMMVPSLLALAVTCPACLPTTSTNQGVVGSSRCFNNVCALAASPASPASPSEHQQNTAGCLSANTGRKYEGHLILHLRPWLRRLVGNEFLRCLRHST